MSAALSTVVGPLTSLVLSSIVTWGCWCLEVGLPESLGISDFAAALAVEMLLT